MRIYGAYDKRVAKRQLRELTFLEETDIGDVFVKKDGTKGTATIQCKDPRHLTLRVLYKNSYREQSKKTSITLFMKRYVRIARDEEA